MRNMCELFRIGSREISEHTPPYVIAEIGVNHDGSVERGLDLIVEAAEAGADAVKFQWFTADALVTHGADTATYQKSQGISNQHELLRNLELTGSEMSVLLSRAHELGMHGIVTVFCEHLVEEASALDWDAWKTASPDIIHRPLIERLCVDGRPIIMSSGASTLEEVCRANQWLAHYPAAFLQCVSSYPTPDEEASLGGIAALANATGRVCGYSDHTMSERMGALAVVAGATILEKHFTHSVAALGPDHSSSLEKDGLRRYIEYSHHAHTAVGIRNEKHLVHAENDVRRTSRQSVRAARPLQKGEVICGDDLVIKRPGDGVEPWKAIELIGRQVARDLTVDHPFMDGDWL